MSFGEASWLIFPVSCMLCEVLLPDKMTGLLLLLMVMLLMLLLLLFLLTLLLLVRLLFLLQLL